MNTDNLYTYKALVTKVYDGDTVTVDVDLGFDLTRKRMVLRLEGLDTPEVRGEERPQGLISRDWLRDKILLKNVIIKTNKDKTGKYGRYIATIYLGDLNINAELIKLGLAEDY